MQELDWQWIIGTAITIGAFIAASIWGIFRVLSGKIDDVLKKIDHNRVITSENIKELHGRIDRIKDDYVRRVDLDSHLSRIDKTLDEVKQMIGVMNTALMQALKEERKP